MPLLKRKSLLAAKIETTSGTAESLSASDAAFNVFDLNMQPTITMTPRPGNGSFSAMPAIRELSGGTCTFRTEVYGTGAGGVPGWASTFLPACGWSNSAGTFSPKSETPGTNVKTLTLAAYVDGKRKLMRGCAGTFRLICETGKIAVIEWTFTGVWVAVTDTALLAPTYPTASPLRVGNATFSIGSWSPCFARLEVNAGNTVVLRECATNSDASGYAAAIITDRLVTGTIDPESALVATADPYGDWVGHTERAFAFDLENATDKFAIAAPKFQITNVQEAERNGMVTDTITFQCNRSAAAGDDEFTFTFSAP
jgi:hypothetical protein